jgi:hypothetical protein
MAGALLVVADITDDEQGLVSLENVAFVNNTAIESTGEQIVLVSNVVLNPLNSLSCHVKSLIDDELLLNVVIWLQLLFSLVDDKGFHDHSRFKSCL